MTFIRLLSEREEEVLYSVQDLRPSFRGGLEKAIYHKVSSEKKGPRLSQIKSDIVKIATKHTFSCMNNAGNINNEGKETKFTQGCFQYNKLLLYFTYLNVDFKQ